MSGNPNYSAPPNWQPPAYAPPPQGPYRPQKASGGGGNGCVLAAVIVFIVVGIPTILACAGIGYFVYFVKTQVEKEPARMAEGRGRIGQPGGIPGGTVFPF